MNLKRKLHLEYFFKYSFLNKTYHINKIILPRILKIDSRVCIFYIKNDLVFSSKQLDNFFRYDIYIYNLFKLKKIIQESIFLVYINDGINEYNNLYTYSIKFFHQTGLKVPVWSFSRDLSMKYKDIFPLVPDDTTFGISNTKIRNIKYPLHYGIFLLGLNMLNNIELSYKKIDLSAFFYFNSGHLSHFHSEFRQSNMNSSLRYFTFNNFFKNIMLDVGNIDNTINNSHKYSLVIDGIGATYPGYLSKLIIGNTMLKFIDNSLIIKNNIMWEQWFAGYKSTLNLKSFPVYIKDSTNVFYIKEEYTIADNFVGYKEINNSFNDKNIDIYFSFMNKKWMKGLEYNDLADININERSFNEQNLLSTPIFCCENIFYNQSIATSSIYKNYIIQNIDIEISHLTQYTDINLLN